MPAPRVAAGYGLLLLLGVLLAVSPLLSPALYAFVDPVNGVPGAAMASGLPRGLVLRPSGVPGEAVVWFDGAGVPHVEGSTVEAAFYAVGWVHASQRLFQMDLFRRLPQAELSALVGEAGLESDRLALLLGFPRNVEESWQAIAGDPGLEELRRIIEAYVRGINDYIAYAESQGMLPVEYRVLGQRPEPWSPEDVVAIAKVFQLMLAWDTDDLVLARLVEKYGPDVIVDLDVVERSRNVAHASCDIATTWGSAAALAPGSLSQAPGQASGGVQDLSLMPSPDPVLEFLREATRFIPRGGLSNNWVVAPGYTESGYPLVANDPHLALTAPSLWILQHVRAPGFNVAGVALPGSPFVIIGRNLSVAWGFTNVGSDFVDFYYYQWVDEETYLYKGEPRKVEREEHVVRVWNPLTGSYREETVVVERTVHGPLIEWGGSRYAVAFTGMGSTTDVVFIYLLNKAGSVEEALAAQRYFGAPVQNMVVADVNGSWAYSPVGRFPQRSNLPVIETREGPVVNTGFLPFNGSEGQGEWAGYVPYEQLPVVYNADAPFVATANSKPFEGDCWRGLGWNYHDRFRTARIQELLSAAIERDGKVGLLDSAMIQLDTRDTGVERLVEIGLGLLRDAGVPPELEEYVALLEDWLARPTMAPGERGGPALALAFAYKLYSKTWEAVYGSGEDLGWFKVEHLEALYDAYRAGEPWVDRYAPQGLPSIALEALREAVELLRQYYGTGDPEFWEYGRLHYYKPDHPFLEPAGLPEAPAPGGPFSVNVAPPATLSPVEGAPVKVGPSVRLLSDLSQPVLLAALPGGTSGNPWSQYYDNLYRQHWLTGRYHAINLVEPAPQQVDIRVEGVTQG